MEELGKKLEEDLYAEIKGEGKIIYFTEEEKKESMKIYASLFEEESEMEKQVREERVKSANRPVYLTF